MKAYITAFLAFTTALCFCKPVYSNYWHTAGYPDGLSSSLADVRSGELLAEKLQESESPGAIFELGRLYYARGLYRQALAFFSRTNFGGDLRLLYIGLCNIVLNEPDSARTALAKIGDPRLRAWSSAGLARISNTIPAAADDFPYLANFFALKSDASAHKKGYTLQFGAFTDSARAEQMVEILKDIGLSPYIQKIQVKEKIFFRVRAESFATKEEAEQAGVALGDQFIFMVVPEE